MPAKNPGSQQRLILDTEVIYCGDNLEKLTKLPPQSVDLIYIDPPFNSNRNYEVFWGETREQRSFDDRHASTQAYIEFMRPRCIELARVLKPTGSLYYHCDWHASHYVKVMLDHILGEPNFRSEIIWKRTFSHGNVGKNFGNIADRVLFYVGSDKYTWNQQYLPLDPEYVSKFYRFSDGDGRRWRLVTLRNPAVRPNLQYLYTALNGITYRPHKNGWVWTRERMRKSDEEGKLVYPRSSEGALMYKQYLDQSNGVRIQNIWHDIRPIGAQAAERVGYPTQKPVQLLERIVTTSSNAGDVVLDAFCGCGSALVAAHQLHRRWIGIDISPTACRVMAKRMQTDCRLEEGERPWREGRGFVVRDLPWSEAQLRRIPAFEFENWAVIALGGIPNKAKVGDMGIDGKIFPTSALPKGKSGRSQFAFMDAWYPVQVKQKDQVGRPDVDSFEAVMNREDRQRGFIVAFDFSRDAKREIRAFESRTGRQIVPVTVSQLLEAEEERPLRVRTAAPEDTQMSLEIVAERSLKKSAAAATNAAKAPTGRSSRR